MNPTHTQRKTPRDNVETLQVQAATPREGEGRGLLRWAGLWLAVIMSKGMHLQLRHKLGPEALGMWGEGDSFSLAFTEAIGRNTETSARTVPYFLGQPKQGFHH